jgi:NAD(P)-dependent dehydrogenase (short-subunit alcohol dehydrogenase family)
MKRVLIVGESSGIGKAVSDKLKNLTEPGREFATVLAFDIFGTYISAETSFDSENVQRFRWNVRSEVPVMLERHFAQGFDAVVHCAAVNKLEPYGKINLTNFREVMDTNVLGTANMLNLLAKHGANAERKCRVIVVGSVAAYTPMRMSAAYNASKAAQAMLVRQAAREFGSTMSVIGVQPSYVPGTKMSNYVKETVKVLRNQTDSEFDDYQLKISPVGRYAEMSEVVECIRWLITDAPAQALTGQFLTPSCGA